MRANPAQVLTFVGKWDGGWKQGVLPDGSDVTAPGAGNPSCGNGNTGVINSGSCCSGSLCASASSWVFPAVTTGPYVWHCHINSHEDSEMMRTSLVVK
jgi:hypothetical protein